MKKLIPIFMLLLPTILVQASVSVEARLQVSKENPFVKETLTLTLEIISRDIEIDPQLDLANLPSRDVLRIIGSFEALAVQRERADNQEITRRRYQAQARAMVPGKITLAPDLQVTARQRVRSFFGSAVQVSPVRIQLQAIALDVRPIPDPPEDFSGIIGDFTADITASPLTILAGDLVTITTTLRGEGWVTESAIPTMPPNPLLRTYRVRAAQADDSPQIHTFSQTVVPLEEDLQELPPMALVWFNTREGAFRRDTFGPFPLRYLREKPDPAPQTEDSTTAPHHAPQRGGMRRNRVQLPEATRAYLAPATTSKTTFAIPPASTVRILESREGWLLIDHDDNRGWIPAPSPPVIPP